MWLQISTPRKQDDNGESSMQTEKCKYGLGWLQKSL